MSTKTTVKVVPNKIPFSIIFDSQGESKGAQKLLAKLDSKLKFENIGFLPGRYVCMFFVEKNDEYKKLRLALEKMLNMAG